MSGGGPNGGEDPQRQGDLRRAARPYSITVGVLFAIFAIFAGINSLSNRSSGASRLDPNEPLPRFAAPGATSGVEKDANLNQDDTDADGDPRTPACQVPGDRDQVIRICDYFDRPLVIVAWFRRGCGSCESQLDTVERVRRRFPGVGFIGLDVRSSVKNAAADVRKNGWRFPMAVDRDGAVGNVYHVIVGPTTIFAYPGGIVMDTRLGEVDERELVQRVRRLIDASRRQGLRR